MINFYLPNFYETNFDILNTCFIELNQKCPQYFYKDVKISAVYGCFPGSIWNGGRVKLGEVKISEIESTINKYNNMGIPIRFTYTNCALTEEKQFNDAYCSAITTIAHNGFNEILVNNKDLEEHLRKNFPNYKYLSSTTKCLQNKNDIIKEADNYYLTVLDYRKNTDIEFLASLPNPEKYEILINAYCSPSCPLRDYHYKIMSEDQIVKKLNVKNYQFLQKTCTLKGSFFEALSEYPTVIKNEDLYNIYHNQLNFQHFKIEGRTNHIIDVLESYLYYMILPEYKDKIRYKVLKQIFSDENQKIR